MRRRNAGPAGRPWRGAWGAFIVGLAVTGIPCVATVSAGASLREGAGPVLVMPFEPAAGQARVYWLEEASAILLTDRLLARGVHAYSRAERVRAFEQLHLPLRVSLSHATVIRVGQLLGASDVVRGTLEFEGATFTVRIHHVRLESGRLLPEIVERAPLSDLFGLFERVAARVAPGESAPQAAEPPPPVEAFENYVKGLIADAPSSRVQFLEAALAVRAEYDEARLALWEALTDAGEHQKAIAVVAAIGDRSPRARFARFLAASSRIAIEDYDRAFEQLQALLEARPSAAIYNNLGLIQLRRGSTPQTGVPTYYLTKAVEAAPDDQDACFNLGYAYWLEGDPKGALYWLRETVRRNPADGDAHLVLAAVLRTLDPVSPEATREEELAGQLSEDAEAFLARRPGGHSVPPGLERLKLDLDESRAARVDTALGTPVQREQREVAAFHLERGRRLFAEHKDREAIDELRRAVFLAPYDADIQLLLGTIFLNGGRLSEAIDALTIAVWSNETAAARVALGEAHFRTGDTAAARTSAERALELDPASSAAKALLERLARPGGVDTPDPVG